MLLRSQQLHTRDANGVMGEEAHDEEFPGCSAVVAGSCVEADDARSIAADAIAHLGSEKSNDGHTVALVWEQPKMVL